VLDSLWTAATRHPFSGAVRDAKIADAAFDRWLAQDALFVADLLTFQARLLARAPRPAQRILAQGCLALAQELDWFEGHCCTVLPSEDRLRVAFDELALSI
jgi:thiaminase